MLVLSVLRSHDDNVYRVTLEPTHNLLFIRFEDSPFASREIVILSACQEQLLKSKHLCIESLSKKIILVMQTTAQPVHPATAPPVHPAVIGDLAAPPVHPATAPPVHPAVIGDLAFAGVLIQGLFS